MVSQSQVRAGKEISPDVGCWWFLRVCDGRGYLLRETVASEIETGDLIVLPPAARIGLRASLLGDLRLCHFGVRMEQLTGFFTAEEQQALHAVGAGAVRLIQREDAVARQHAELCALRYRQPCALARSAMLSLAVQALRDILTSPAAGLRPVISPEQKLAELSARLPESELLAHTSAELAHECGCTERHFRRLFAGRFGAPLKHRQTVWRIEQAKKLLLETEAKVIDVAGQCGFCSLGQFNLTFKRLTNITPGAWRKTFALTKAKYHRQHPAVCPRANT